MITMITLHFSFDFALLFSYIRVRLKVSDVVNINITNLLLIIFKGTLFATWVSEAVASSYHKFPSLVGTSFIMMMEAWSFHEIIVLIFQTSQSYTSQDRNLHVGKQTYAKCPYPGTSMHLQMSVCLGFFSAVSDHIVGLLRYTATCWPVTRCWCLV
jgi:hypothetical protein